MRMLRVVFNIEARNYYSKPTFIMTLIKCTEPDGVGQKKYQETYFMSIMNLASRCTKLILLKVPIQ